jgi:hypothetical protein
MASERSLTRARLPTLIEKIGSWLLIIPSIILGVLIVELSGHVFLSPRTNQSFDMRTRGVVFLDGSDAIFRNQGDIFTYVPHNQIRNVTGFLSDNDFLIEYDYRFRTNNFGLVQDDDIVPERQSLLLLGDSFTEGQGAEPWFRSVSPEVSKLGFQAINGGLLATGFEQWLKLDRYLASNNVRIRKVVVLFISFGYGRPVLSFNPNDFQCLIDLRRCRFEDTFFYRLPPRDELSWWIAKIRAARAPTTKKSWLGGHVEALLPASYHVYRYLNNVSERFGNAANILRALGAEQQSHTAIAELIRIYGPQNVAFLHLPQKNEVENGAPIKLGWKARRAIEDAGGRLFDGFRLCRLTQADYYPNDEHPNRDGYAKISSCTTEVIKKMVTQVQ